MKIYINKPRNHWLSPYTILEKTLFWLDWDNIDYDTPWVQKWSDRISPISNVIEKILGFINPQITYVRIDGFDAWNAYHTLSLVILPTLMEIVEFKGGTPYTYTLDAPIELESLNKDGLNEEGGHSEERWAWILNEMIFAFKHIADNSWEEKFHTGEIDIDFIPGKEVDEKGKPLFYQMVDGPNDTHKFDYDGYNKVQKRISNGLILFGKYYQSLWT